MRFQLTMALAVSLMPPAGEPASAATDVDTAARDTGHATAEATEDVAYDTAEAAKKTTTLQVTPSTRRGTALRRAPAKQRIKVKYPSYYTLSIASELKSDVSSTPRRLTVAVRQLRNTCLPGAGKDCL